MVKIKCNYHLCIMILIVLIVLPLVCASTALAIDIRDEQMCAESGEGKVAGEQTPVLDERREAKICADYLYKLQLENPDDQTWQNMTVDRIGVSAYYGSHSGYDVVVMSELDIPANSAECEIVIAGYMFWFPLIADSQRFFAYKDGDFTHLSDAYARGLVTQEDVHAIAIIKGDFPYYFSIYTETEGKGRISPNNRVDVSYGENITFTITADDGYAIADVLVDNSSVGPLSTYEFKEVSENHSILAIFKASVDKFKDLDHAQWYMDGVRFVVEKELYIGVSGTEFAPDGKMSRAMFVQALYNLSQQLGLNSVTKAYKNPYEDVESGQWFEVAVAWAAGNDLIDGYSPITFGPDDNITREQMAKLLSAYSDHADFNLVTDGNAMFSDFAQVSDWAEEYVYRAVAVRLMNGYPDGTFAPKAFTTRAEAATAIMRMVELYVKL